MTITRIRKAMSYAIGFRLIEGVVLAPLMGLVGHLLLGRTVLDSTAIVRFFMSPKGLFALVSMSVCLLVIRMMEQAGLSVLVAEEFGAKPLLPISALKVVLSRALPILRAAARGTVLVLGMLAPLAILAGLVMRYLTAQHDINFYLAERPTDFLVWVAVIGVVALVTTIAIFWYVVRWRWVVNVILFEDITGKAAFTRSTKLVNGIAMRIALQWGAIGILYAALGLFASWIGRLLLPLGIDLFGASARSLGALLGFLVVLQAIIGSIVVMAGPIIEAIVFTRAYFKRSKVSAQGWPARSTSPLRTKKVIPAWLLAALVVAATSLGAAVGGIWGTQALSLERPVQIIGHRAAVTNVPENTARALEQAIQAGANSAEIDVQLSRDGIVVVAHDQDFSRQAGVAKRVSDLTWKEIQNIDIGSHVGPPFAKAYAPTLEQYLKAARGRIHLLVELKHYSPVNGKLEAKVVDLIRRYSVKGEIEIQSLEYDSLQIVRKMEPSLPIGYLMSMNARMPERLDVDFLSVIFSRVNARFLRQARRDKHRVYVWTVNETPDLERMMDLGVDGLITNEAPAAIALLRERSALSPGEKSLRRLRAWLAK